MQPTSTTYTHVRIQIIRGKSSVFIPAMAALKEILERDYGWRMVGGFTAAIGTIGEVVHIWNVPSPNAIVETLTEVRARPDTQEISARLAESVESETFYVMAPMPYAPTP